MCDIYYQSTLVSITLTAIEQVGEYLTFEPYLSKGEAQIFVQLSVDQLSSVLQQIYSRIINATAFVCIGRKGQTL